MDFNIDVNEWFQLFKYYAFKVLFEYPIRMLRALPWWGKYMIAGIIACIMILLLIFWYKNRDEWMRIQY